MTLTQLKEKLYYTINKALAEFSKQQDYHNFIVKHHNKILAINILDLEETFYLHFHNSITLLSEINNLPDVANKLTVNTRLSGNLLSLIRMLIQNKAKQNLEITGDITLLEDLKNAATIQNKLAEGKQWLETNLAEITGDVVASNLIKVASKTHTLVKRNLKERSLDLSSYLQEEIKVLPSKEEMDIFLNGVDKLQQKIDKLEAKLKHRKTVSQ